jgi:hypothetical protein
VAGGGAVVAVVPGTVVPGAVVVSGVVVTGVVVEGAVVVGGGEVVAAATVNPTVQLMAGLPVSVITTE